MKIKNYIYPFTIFASVLTIFSRALFNFYTHDDWFHFRISKANSIGEFFNFFNFTHGPDGWGYYRPLTTQVIYFLNSKLFNYSPLAMHVFAFILFFLLIFIVYKFVYLLTNNITTTKVAVTIYALSASHFPHLYSIANQELGHAIFYVSSVYFYLKYFNEIRNKKYLIFSILLFVGALVSKEMAITLPGILVLLLIYLHVTKKINITIKKAFLYLLPFILIWSVYIYFHVFEYGLVEGDSYLWNISPKVAINSIIWYLLWSINLPTMLVDYVGPGLNFNSNLFKYWSDEIIPIFITFGLMLSSLGVVFISVVKKLKITEYYQYIFMGLWFAIPLTPVIFLQWHKYPTYLTIPLIGLSVIIASMIVKFINNKKSGIINKIIVVVFFACFLITSKLTHDLNFKTNWLTSGAKTSKLTYDYINNNFSGYEKPIKIAFYDTQNDSDLPWSPTEQLKVALSDQNFFRVFYPGEISAVYESSESAIIDESIIKVPSRQFMGY